MKRTLKSKFLCVVLALVIMASPLSVVGANAEKYTPDCPYINVHGFMGTNIYVDPDDPNSELAWPPSSKSILKAVGKSLPHLFRVMVFQDWEKFGDDVIPIVNELFASVCLAPNGETENKSGIRFTYPKKSEITKTSQLNFLYDWRLNPIQSAGELKKFIDYVLEASGSKKVVLEGHSYGGVVILTYAKLYGTSKVKSFCFNSTAVYGEDYSGELFTGKMRFNPESLTEYLKGAFDYNKNEKFLNFIFESLYKTGVTCQLCKLVNWMMDKITMEKLSLAIIPMYAGWLSVWAMVPDHMMKDAYSYIFDVCYKNDSTDRSGLKAKIKEYNTKIRPYKTNTLETINNNANLYVIARYGYSGMFMVPSWVNETDTVIDLKYASFGATVAKHGETISEKYLAKVNPKYISPGKNIDASTALFPQQTWYIKNFTHSHSTKHFEDMVKVLLYSKTQATVDTYKEYTRYLTYNEDTGTIDIDK